MEKKLEKIIQLSEQQLLEIKTLAENCYQADHYRAKIYWDIIKKRKNNRYNDFLC